MASDGCQPVPWAGSAFPYLLHRPRSDTDEAPKDHASSRGEPVASSSSRQAATGTWNGPAPRGKQASSNQGSSAAATPACAAAPEPRALLLPGGGRLPILGLSTGTADAAELRRAYFEGYRCFDVTPGFEGTAGPALAALAADHGREQLFIIGRLPNDAHRPAVAVEAARQLPQQLGCGHLDLLLVDWPVAWVPGGAQGEVDEGVTLADTWAALESAVDCGAARSLGLANCSLVQVEQLLGSCRIKPVVNCIELHPMMAQRKLVGVCLRKGVHSMAALPLAGGLAALLGNPKVTALAEECGKTPVQVLLRWAVQRGTPLLVGAGSESAAAFGCTAAGLFDWSLSFEQKSVLDQLDCGHRVLAPDWAEWGDPEQGGAGKARYMLPQDSTIF